MRLEHRLVPAATRARVPNSVTLRQGWEAQGSGGGAHKAGPGRRKHCSGQRGLGKGSGTQEKPRSEGHTAHLRLAARSAGLLDSVLGRSRV